MSGPDPDAYSEGADSSADSAADSSVNALFLNTVSRNLITALLSWSLVQNLSN